MFLVFMRNRIPLEVVHLRLSGFVRGLKVEKGLDIGPIREALGGFQSGDFHGKQCAAAPFIASFTAALTLPRQHEP